MIIVFLLIVCFLNHIFAKNQAIGFFIKNDYLGGRIVGLVFTYIFFGSTIFISYKTNQNIILNTLLFISGSFINYVLYSLFYKIYYNKYEIIYNENPDLFLLKYK